MQLWKWLLALGLLFMITYEPSRGGGKLMNYFIHGTVDGTPDVSRETQKYSDSSDDD
jgi:hypothetical protein